MSCTGTTDETATGASATDARDDDSDSGSEEGGESGSAADASGEVGSGSASGADGSASTEESSSEGPADASSSTSTNGDAESTGTDTTSTSTSGSEESGDEDAPATESEGGTPGDVFLVEDFEDIAAGGPPDPATWTIFPATADISVSTEDAHSGSQSIRVSTETGESYAYFSTVMGFPPPESRVHFRFWMKFSVAGWENHVTFLASGPVLDRPGTEPEIRLGGQANTYHANAAGYGSDDLSPNPWVECANCITPVAGEWHCIDGFFDGLADEVQASIDGDIFVDAAGPEDWHVDNAVAGRVPDSLDRLSFGWHALGGGPQNTFFFDDIELSYEGPLECD